MSEVDFRVGDTVSPTALSVNFSTNSRRWIGCLGTVEKVPTPTQGVLVRFAWTDHPDWSDARFVYRPSDLELISSRGATKGIEEKIAKSERISSEYTEMARRLRAQRDAARGIEEKIAESVRLAAKYSEMANNLRAQRDTLLTRRRQIGQVWRAKVSGNLFLVRGATGAECEDGVEKPIVCIGSTRGDMICINDTLINMTDEDFYERFEYVGRIENMCQRAGWLVDPEASRVRA
jgi:hypothetical protein